MKSEKPKRALDQWLRDPSMAVSRGDELIDKHLTFPRRETTSHFFFSGKRWRLVENGKVTFDVEARPELWPVHLRLMEALLQEKLLIARLREAVERPKNVKRPNTIEKLVLEAAASLLVGRATSKASLASLVHRAAVKAIQLRSLSDEDLRVQLARKKSPVTVEYVRKTLRKAESTFPALTLREAITQSLKVSSAN
jgi:hypothetical protein